MIRVENLSARYGNKTVFSDASFEILPGKLSVLLGPNGSGKTTLLRVLSGMHPAFSGKIFLGEKPVSRYRSDEISKVLSVVLTSEIITPLKVFDVLASGRFPYLNRFNFLKKKDLEVIEKVADELDLNGFLHRTITELSDGERQRVMIARALVQQTPIMLLDEPDTHLDIMHRAEMLQLLKRIAGSGKTVLFSTHYLDLIFDTVDDVVVIEGGNVIKTSISVAVEQGVFDKVFTGDLLIFDKSNRQFKLKK
jgi:iron complex transport system ATP-binding protein